MNLISACDSPENLEKAIEYARNTNFAEYESNTKKIVDSIDDYIKSSFGL